MNEGFMIKALRGASIVRLDSRSGSECRDVDIMFHNKPRSAEVRIGGTIVRSIARSEIVTPLTDRPNEGKLNFSVDVTPYEALFPEIARFGGGGVSLCNYVERVLKGSKAFDAESLCILAGKSAWSIKCDIRVHSADGNLQDACSLAALCALAYGRHEAVSIQGESAVLHVSTAMESISFSLHHIPVSTTFGLFESPDGIKWIVDPTRAEEECIAASLSIAVNQHGELCALHKPGGLEIPPNIFVECLDMATLRARRLTELVQSRFKDTN